MNQNDITRGLPRTYWLLWSGMLLNRLGGSVFFLLALYLTRQRGFSPEFAGVVISLYAAGATLAGPLGGALADRLGRRVPLLTGTAAAGTLMLALGFARSTTAIAVIAPSLGLATDLCRPPFQAAVSDLVAPADRARAYGLLYWALNLGFAGAASLGGTLAEHHFQSLFVIDALTTFGFGLIVLVAVPETRPPLEPKSARAIDDFAALAPFRDGVFMIFVGIQLLLLLAFVQVIVALPLDMRAHGLSTVHIGWLLGLNGVLIVVAQPIALRYVRGLSHAQWLAGGAALTGLGLGAMSLAGGASVYALSAILWTLGEIGFSTAAPALVAELSPTRRRGVYQGTYQLGWGLATMLGPLVGTSVLTHFGGHVLWLGCLLACFGAAALHLTVSARRERATARFDTA